MTRLTPANGSPLLMALPRKEPPQDAGAGDGPTGLGDLTMSFVRQSLDLLPFKFITISASGQKRIGHPLLLVSNPEAGGGRGMALALDFLKMVSDLRRKNLLFVDGDIRFVGTHRDRRERIDSIAGEISVAASGGTPIVLVFAGDGTFADVAEAYLIAKKGGSKNAWLVPCSGGVACDLRHELGVPRDIPKLIRFLEIGEPSVMNPLKARFNGGPERLILQTQGNGVSGAFFAEVAKGRFDHGDISVPIYLNALMRGMAGARGFTARVRIGDGAPQDFVAGEVLLINATSLGSIGRMPLPMVGGRLFIVPVDSGHSDLRKLFPALPVMFDSAVRGAMYALGEQDMIAPGLMPHFLDKSRMIDIIPGVKVEIEILDLDGHPAKIASMINGDPVEEEIGHIAIEGPSISIPVLANPNSANFVRLGVTPPAHNIPPFIRAPIDAMANGGMTLCSSVIQCVNLFSMMARG